MLANFSNLITFSRGSNATVTDASGRLTYAANNLVTNSQDFEASAWTKLATTVASNTMAAPDGSITADTVTEAASTTWHGVFTGSPPTIVSGQNYTLSVYLKAGTRRYVQLALGALGAGQQQNFGVVVDTGVTPMRIVSTGNGTSGTYVASSVQDAGSGWYRISVTGSVVYTSGFFSVSGAAGDTYSINPVNNGSGTYSVWGAQLEAVTYQTTPSPYVSTSVANLLGFSEAFDNAAWTKLNAAIVPNAAQNPINGLWNAQKLMENTANGVHYALQAVSVLAIPYTLSTYAKAGERSFLSLGFDNLNAWFNLSTGTVGTVEAGLTASITSVGNGWYRCAVSRNVAAAATRSCVIYPANANGNVVYTGDGNSGIYIYGAQLSNSGSLDPYVPTPGAAPSSTAYYGPRFDYDPVTLAAKGILIEEQRTNLLTYSEQFDNAAWSKFSVAITANSTIAPDGTLTADTLTSTGTVTDGVGRGLAFSAGAYTFSVYLKQGNTAFSEVQMIDQGTVINRVRLTYATGALTVVAGSPTGTATNVGNGWWRVSITYTFPASGPADTVSVLPGAYNSTTVGEFCYFWGAQLEQAAFATSYIPTVASQVTRTADVASITGSLFSQWYNQSQGSFFIRAIPSAVGSYTSYSATDGSFNNRIQGPASSSFQYLVGTGGVIQALLDAGTLTAGSAFKTASSYAPSQFAVSLDGGAVTSASSGTVPTVTRFDIGNLSGFAEFLNGHIQNITYIPNAVSASQLQSATT